MRLGAAFGLVAALMSCTPDHVGVPPRPPSTGSAVARSAEGEPVASASASPVAASSATAVDEVPRPPPSPRMLETLRDNAVYHDAVGRKVLYTWTNACHLADIRQFKRLLYRTDLPGAWGSSFDARLRLRPNDPVAKMLSGPAFRHRRPAWPTTWGARAPMIKERGDVVLRVELRDDAVIAVLDAERKDGWRFVGVNGAPIAADDVLRDPRKLAAVYHVWHGDDAEPEPDDQSPFPFREYLLCNESMVASVEASTPRLKKTVSREIQFLEAMATYVEGLNEGEPAFEPWKSATADGWRAHRPDGDALTLWNAAAPTAAPAYVPTPQRIGALRDELARVAAFSEPPLVLRERVPFGAPPKAPPPRRWSLDPTMVFPSCPD